MTITTELEQRLASCAYDRDPRPLESDECEALLDALAAKDTENERMARDLLARGVGSEDLFCSSLLFRWR